MKLQRISVSSWPRSFSWFRRTGKCRAVEVTLVLLALDLVLGISVLDAVANLDKHTDGALDMAEISWATARNSLGFAGLDPQELPGRLARTIWQKFGNR